MSLHIITVIFKKRILIESRTQSWTFKNGYLKQYTISVDFQGEKL